MKLQILFFLIIVLGLFIPVKAQDSLEYNDDFKKFVEEANDNFSKFKEDIDKEFLDFLNKTWKEMERFEGVLADTTPKPKKIPIARPTVPPTKEPPKKPEPPKKEIKPLPPEPKETCRNPKALTTIILIL